MIILYNLRTYVHDLNGSVMMRVRWEHKTRTVVFACGVFAETSKWDCDQQRAKKNTVHVVNGHSCSAREINAAIAELKEIIDEAFKDFGRDSHSPSSMELKDRVKGILAELHPRVEKTARPEGSHFDGLFHVKTIQTVFNEFIEDMKERMKWRGVYTEHHYNEIRNNITEFIKSSAHYSGVTIKDIDTHFLNELKRWYVNKKYYNKTTNKQFSNLKSVLRWAKAKGYPVRDDALLYKTELDDPQKVVVYLYYNELIQLLDYPFPQGGHLDKMRDLFCFMALTSLRYSDLKNLKKTDVLEDTIRLFTQKTHKQVLIPITERARTIINKYKDIVPGEYLFNVSSDQKINDGIKEAAKEAGLNRLITEVHCIGKDLIQETHPLHETLSCHDARRTFVCISLRLGIPAEIVMKSTGHSNHVAMKPYMEIMEESVTEQMQKWDSPPQQKKESLIELKEQLAELQQKIANAEKGLE